MKYNKGIAPLVIILAIVVVGGTVFAVVQRNVLKSYFEKGDKPTEAQFADTIDSSLNLVDDADRTGDAQKMVAPAPAPASAGIPGQKEYNPTKGYEAGDTAVFSDPAYQAKVLSNSDVAFTLDKAEPVTFHWTPTSPKPQEPVTYRMKVWQLMQGQNGTQAMKSNTPIITKDVTDMNEVTVSDLYTGPCKPPYLCNFVWSVEVLATISSKTDTSEGVAPTPPPTTGTTDTTQPADSTGSTGTAR